MTILNMPFHMRSVQMYWKIFNMEVNLWELAIHINIINIAVILYSLRSAMPGPNNDFVIKK